MPKFGPCKRWGKLNPIFAVFRGVWDPDPAEGVNLTYLFIMSEVTLVTCGGQTFCKLWGKIFRSELWTYI